jgi:hypothetical protein
VIYILADTVEYSSDKVISDRLRPAEKEIVTMVGSNSRNYIAVFDTRYN